MVSNVTEVKFKWITFSQLLPCGAPALGNVTGPDFRHLVTGSDTFWQYGGVQPACLLQLQQLG